MKKPHETYRKYRTDKSRLAKAFRSARHPFRSLRSMFRTPLERDIADNMSGMEACKRGVQMVLAAMQAMGKAYRGPRLSHIFASLNMRRRVENTDFRGPAIN